MHSHEPTHTHIAPLWSMAVGDLGRFLIILAVGLFALSFLSASYSGATDGPRRALGLFTGVALLAFAAAVQLTGAVTFHFDAAVGAIGGLIFLGLAIAAVRTGMDTTGKVRERVPAWAFTAGCLSLFGAITSLGVLFAFDQLHYKYVIDHGDFKTDLKYKIAGIWSGQEGSFLLWGCMSAVFGLFGARVSDLYRRWYTATFALFLLGLCAILAYESPFHIHPDALAVAKQLPTWTQYPGLPIWPQEGAGLSPTLQNYWVVIHPPTIFAGFGSLTLLFCFAVAAILTRNVKDWVPIVRPWTLVSMAVLGIGLCMGGFWAYETLGWGGFWAWDPVENVSFVPWCFVTALIHGLIVQTTRGRWIPTNLLLAALPFLLFVYGTFMTRSGFLEDQSVHSFAEMNRTALWLLVGILGIMTLGFLTLWLWKGLALGRTEEPLIEKGVHREGGYRWGAILLAGLGVATAVGMSVPLIQSLIGQSPKRVEEHAYHLILSWFFVPIMVLMAAGPFISWRGMPMRQLLNRLLNIFSVSLGLVGILLFLAKRYSPWAGLMEPDATIAFPFGRVVPLFPWMVFLAWLCTFTFVANMWRIVELWKRSKGSIGGFLSHIGVAVLLAGLIISRGFEQKAQLFVQDGRPGAGLGYTISYKGRTEKREDFFNRDNKILFDVQGPDQFVASIGQFYVRSNDPEATELPQTTWPYIHHTLWHDVYIQLSKEAILAGDPIELKPGETKVFDELSLTYDKLEMQGEPGQPGTKFIAHLRTSSDRDVNVKSAPYMQITEQGLARPLEVMSSGFLVQLMGMDAGSKTVTVQLFYRQPLYPIEIFYKPMTMLVWTGTGILTFGGLMSAWYRRRARASVPAPIEEPLPAVENKEDAPAPVA